MLNQEEALQPRREEERAGAVPSPMILHCLLHGGWAEDKKCFQATSQVQATLMMSWRTGVIVLWRRHRSFSAVMPLLIAVTMETHHHPHLLQLQRLGHRRRRQTCGVTWHRWDTDQPNDLYRVNPYISVNKSLTQNIKYTFYLNWLEKINILITNNHTGNWFQMSHTSVQIII